MSTNIIEENVVEMQFDNDKFEKNIDTSMRSIEELKKSLTFEQNAKSMDVLNDSVKNINFDSLRESVDTIGDRFTNLGIIGVTALQNITNKAIDTGTRLLKSLTIDQVKGGFDEYELKMGSIQTIMASTGEKIETVNKYLNELNTYSDRTIYSFSDMTNNIGKFTNAGVKLDTAVKAIQGISNEAAVSGANANEASRAMYNFAQALSAGYVKLIDWKSIENANMATKEFKTQLLDTAVELKLASKQSDGMYKILAKNNKGKTMSDTISATKNFNDSLSYQWMTTDVLTKTLAKYSDETTKIGKKAFAAAQDIKTYSQLMDTLKESVGSGWAQTFELIFGNLNEAKKLWTAIGKWADGIISKSADARNNLLKEWKKDGGRKDLIESISLIGKMATSAGKALSDNLVKVLPKINAKSLLTLTTNIKNSLSSLNDMLFSKSIGRKQFSVFDVIAKGVSAVVSVIQVPLNFIKAFIDFMKDIWNAIKPDDSTIKETVNEFRLLFDEIIKFSKAFTPNWFTENVFKPIEEVLGTTGKTIGNLLPSLSKLKDHVSKVFKAIKDAIEEVSNVISKAASHVKSFFKGLVDWFKSINVASEDLKKAAKNTKDSIEPFEVVMNTLKTVWNTIKVVAGTVIKILGGVFEQIKGYFADKDVEEVINSLSNIILDFFKVFTAGSIAKTINVVGKNISKFSDGIASLGSAFGDIAKMPEKFIGAIDSVKNTVEKVDETTLDRLKKLALSILAISVALTMISTIDTKSIGSVMGAFSGAIAEFVAAFYAIGKISGMFNIKAEIIPVKSIGDLFTNISNVWKANAGINNVLKMMITVAGTMFLLAVSLKKISTIPSEKMLPSFLLFSGILWEMVGVIAVLNVISKDKDADPNSLKKVTACIAIISASISALIPFFDLLGLLPLSRAGVAILAFSAILWEMVGALAVLKIIGEDGDPTELAKTTACMLLLSQVLTGLIPFLTLMGVLPWKRALQSCIAFTVVMWEMIGAIAVLNIIGENADPAELVKVTACMLLLSQVLTGLIPFLTLMGALPWDKALQSVVAFTVVMWEMIGAIAVLNIIGENGDPTELVKVTACMLLLSKVLTGLIPFLTLMGALPWDKALQAGIAFSVVMWEMVGVIAVMNIIGESIDIASIVTLIGAMVVLSGVINSLIPFLTMLSIINPDQAEQALLGFTVVLGLLLTAVFALTMLGNMGNPGNVIKMAGAMIMVAAAISILTPPLLAMSLIPFSSLAGGLAAVGIMLLMFAAAVTYLAPYGAVLFEVSGGLLLFGVAVALVGVGLLTAGLGLQALAVGLTAIVAMLPAMLGAILAAIPMLVAILREFVIQLIDSFIQIKPKLVELGKTIVTALIDTMVTTLSEASRLIEAVLTFIDKLLASLEKHVKPWAQKMINIVLKILNEVAKNVGKFVKILINFAINLVDGLAQGIEDNKERIKESFLNLCMSLLDLIKEFFGIHSPSTKMAEIGMNLILGLLNGIKDKASELKNKMLELVKNLINVIKSKISDFRNKGKEMITNLLSGIRGKISTVLSTLASFGSSMKAKFTNLVSQFTAIGRNIIDGLKNGIAVRKQALIGRLEEVANLIPAKVKQLLGIRSPSRVFIEIGKYIMQGLNNGIVGNTKSVLASMSKSMSSLTDLAGMDLDMSPTITPVINMDGVNSGIGQINSLFSGQTLAMNANLSSLSASMSRRQNRTTNADVVSAIDKLRNDFVNRPQTVNNIDGVTYAGDSDISDAINILVNAAIINERSS